MATPVVPKGFVLDEPQLPEGFILDAPETSPIKQEQPSVLPSFMDLSSPEEQQKIVEMVKTDPERARLTLQEGGIKAAQRGIQDIGEGFKQLSLEAGEAIGITEPGTAEDYTRQVQEGRQNFEESYGLIPGNKISRFVGANAPYAYLPIKMPASLFGKTGVLATTTARTLTGAGVTGGITGTQFVPEGESRAKRTAIGAGIGAGIPIAGTALTGIVKWADGIIRQPFTKAGAYKDIANFLRKEITENRDKIEAAVRESVKRGENKTVAQIIAETTKGTGKNFGGMLVRLEKDLSRESDVLKSLWDTAKVGHKNIIGKIAGTEDDLANAISARTNTAKANYDKAFQVDVTGDPKLARIANNKFFKQAAKDAQGIAEVRGITPKKNLTEYLHYVKEGLDKQLNATDAKGKVALGREELKAVGEVKDALVKWIGKKNPIYDQARIQFQKDSIPINKMELGQELKAAYSNALEKESPAIFARAVKDAHKTIKKAIGFKQYKKLDDVLGGKTAGQLESIKKELAIDTRKAAMAAQSKPILGELSGEVIVSLPRILSRPVVITNHLLKALGRDMTPEYKRMLVDMVRDPKKFLKAYKMPESDKKARMAMDIVNRMNAITATKAVTDTTEE